MFFTHRRAFHVISDGLYLRLGSINALLVQPEQQLRRTRSLQTGTELEFAYRKGCKEISYGNMYKNKLLNKRKPPEERKQMDFADLLVRFPFTGELKSLGFCLTATLLRVFLV